VAFPGGQPPKEVGRIERNLNPAIVRKPGRSQEKELYFTKFLTSGGAEPGGRTFARRGRWQLSARKKIKKKKGKKFVLRRSVCAVVHRGRPSALTLCGGTTRRATAIIGFFAIWFGGRRRGSMGKSAGGFRGGGSPVCFGCGRPWPQQPRARHCTASVEEALACQPRGQRRYEDAGGFFFVVFDVRFSFSKRLLHHQRSSGSHREVTQLKDQGGTPGWSNGWGSEGRDGPDTSEVRRRQRWGVRRRVTGGWTRMPAWAWPTR